MRRAFVLPAFLAFAACEDLAHVDDFHVATSASSAEGGQLCTMCPASVPGISRVPCPRGATEAAAGETYVYAVHDLTLGANATQLADPGYDIGLDFDCSTREDGGLPGSCTPNEASISLIPSPPWTALPRGIDNALAQRVIGPLLAFEGTALDLDATISAAFTQGKVGTLVVVQNWDGTPDDDDVLVSFLGSAGTTAPPKWDGTDVWIPNGTLASYAAYPSYVSGGVLVSDTRSVGEDDTTIAIEDAAGDPVTFTLKGRLLVRFGPLTRDSFLMTTAGRWDLSDAMAQVTALATFIGNGDSTLTQALTHLLPNLFTAAADLPSGDQPTPGAACEAISTAMQGHASRAIFGTPAH